MPDSTNTPVYRKICSECQRPAITVDEDGTPYCPEHARTFRAEPSAPDDAEDDLGGA